MRGFAGQFSKSLLVLIDGRSVYTPLFSGVYWDVQNVMLEDVDRIEVIRGPGGTIWGANAVNGVINIITKSAKDTHGLALQSGRRQRGAGSRRYPLWAAHRRAASAIASTAWASCAVRNFIPTVITSTAGGWAKLGFRTDWTRGAKDNFTVQGELYRGESGENFCSPPTLRLPKFAEQDKSASSGGNLVARWQHKNVEKVPTFRFRPTLTAPTATASNSARHAIHSTWTIIQHARTHQKQELTWGLGARLSPDNVIQSSPSVNVLPNKHTDTHLQQLRSI